MYENVSPMREFFRKKWVKLVLVVDVLVVVAVNCGGVSALSKEQERIFSNNQIIFYNPTGSRCSHNIVNNGMYKTEPFGQMSDELLKKFAAAGIDENGHSGVAFELSLLANLYEERKCSVSCAHTAEDLSEYLLSTDWFANQTKMSFRDGVSVNHGEPTEADIGIAKDVLVNGNRVAPKGINEHDDIGDIVSVVLNGQQVDKNNANNYVSGKTMIHNRQGADYTFFAWCDGQTSKSGAVNSSCDPFGYTNGLQVQQSYSTVTSTTSNTLYNGQQALSDAQLQQIESNRDIYEQAASEYDMPWQLLAALHYREHSLSITNPSNGQGIYQLYSYTGGGNNANRFVPGEVSRDEFLRQSKIAAEVIRQKVGSGVDLNNDDNVKRAFFMYNGTAAAYKDKALCMGFSQEQANNGEGSPYVMNMADAMRDPNSAEMSSCWPGRYSGDHQFDNTTESRPGAYAVFKALGGGNGLIGDYCATSGNGNQTFGDIIAEAALRLSWDCGSRSGCQSKSNPNPEYIEAMKAVGSYQSWGPPAGASCDQFVSTVMRSTGMDKDFKKNVANELGAYMASHPELYTEINYDGSNPEILMPGDIFSTVGSGTGGHIYIYVKIDGEHGIADASHNDRTAEHYKNSPYIVSNGRRFRVFRRTNS